MNNKLYCTTQKSSSVHYISKDPHILLSSCPMEYLAPVFSDPFGCWTLIQLKYAYLYLLLAVELNLPLYLNVEYFYKENTQLDEFFTKTKHANVLCGNKTNKQKTNPNCQTFHCILEQFSKGLYCGVDMVVGWWVIYPLKKFPASKSASSNMIFLMW